MKTISALATLAVLLPLAVSADQPVADAAANAAAQVSEAASDAAAAASEKLAGAGGAASDATAKLVEQAKKVAEGVPTNVNREPFKPTSAKAPFFEQFTADWNKRWQVSAATKEQKEGEVFAYVGEWKVEEPTVYPGLIGDEGLVAKSKAAQHAISASFDKPLDPKGKPLVVQYEVKLQNGLVCGGAYLKLLTESPEGIQAKEFSDKTPYTIMFGPDKCGATNKVHFIFRHKNPVTGEIEEKHLANTPYPKISKTTSLYTLVVNPDQTFEIFINGDSKSKGSLLEDFEPAVNPPKEIDDPEDKKPSDWVDLKRIADPAAAKPEDWDEDAPREIPDEEAVQPEGWLNDEPATVPDPEAVKPAEWDDEEDGEWVAPLVPNPKCVEAPGCGEWKRPTIKNPAYKGKWTAPYIDNPDYKGEWAAKKIANPAFFEDKSPADFTPIGGVGFEIWTMDEDILFDNIYVGHSLEEAQRIQKETFDLKSAIEASTEKKDVEEQAKETAKETVKKSGDLVADVVARLKDFVAAAREDPIAAAKGDTQVAGGLVVGLLGLFGTLGLVLGGGAKAAAPQAKKLAKKVDAPKIAEQAKSSAVKATEEVKKRANAVVEKAQE